MECSFGRESELTPADADILIQVRRGDVMWQKERLLDVALASLPPECTAVAWLDCDVVFHDGDWPGRTLTALQEAPIVQLYRNRYHPARDLPDDRFDPSAFAPAAVSLIHLINTGLQSKEALSQAGLPLGLTLGLAWAARRELLDRHGLYDACILGSADKAIVCAAYGLFDIVGRSLHMTPSRFDHFLDGHARSMRMSGAGWSTSTAPFSTSGMAPSPTDASPPGTATWPTWASIHAPIWSKPRTAPGNGPPRSRNSTPTCGTIFGTVTKTATIPGSDRPLTPLPAAVVRPVYRHESRPGPPRKGES